MQARTSHAEQLADLADVVMAVARAVRSQAAADPDVVELSATEVTVLRYIDHHPDVSAGTVAAGTGLQRSNLSRALRDLEAVMRDSSICGLGQAAPNPVAHLLTLFRKD